MSSTVILPSSNNSEGPSTATPTPALPPPTPNVKSKRIFMYQGKQYLDPSEEGGETWSIEMVRNQLALIYPELTNATWQEIPQPDGSVLIEFVKVSGEKGQQTTFFSDDNTSPGQRVFVVEGKYFDDPGPMYTIQQIRDHFAQTYPHLSNATWESRHLADGREEITFVKVTGEKGSNPATIAELTQQLIKA
ncbi:MAG: PRTRC system protein C [Chloroflexota bacterium]